MKWTNPINTTLLVLDVNHHLSNEVSCNEVDKPNQYNLTCLGRKPSSI